MFVSKFYSITNLKSSHDFTVMGIYTIQFVLQTSIFLFQHLNSVIQPSLILEVGAFQVVLIKDENKHKFFETEKKLALV